MSRVAVYSFRTNDYAAMLSEEGSAVFVFGKLHMDLGRFCEFLEESGSKHVVGVARTNCQSHIELQAIHQFGKHKKVDAFGLDSYSLYIPRNCPFALSKRPTTSFCNWTMYKLAQFAEQKGITVSFVHLHDSDLLTFKSFISKLD